MDLGVAGFNVKRSAPLKYISWWFLQGIYWRDNLSTPLDMYNSTASNSLVTRQKLNDNLTSNQVGLPAELKHINKRRKRN